MKRSVGSRLVLAATLAILTSASVFAQGDDLGPDDGMSAFTLLVRGKFGTKDFDDGWPAAYEHDMFGAEVEIRLGTGGARIANYLSVIVGLEFSSGDEVVPGPISVDMDVGEMDLGLRYTLGLAPIGSRAYLSLYAGGGLASFDGTWSETPGLDYDLSGEGYYVEFGAYLELTLSSQMTLIAGVGIKRASVDIDIDPISVTLTGDPESVQFSVGLRF